MIVSWLKRAASIVWVRGTLSWLQNRGTDGSCGYTDRREERVQRDGEGNWQHCKSSLIKICASLESTELNFSKARMCLFGVACGSWVLRGLNRAGLMIRWVQK